MLITADITKGSGFKVLSLGFGKYVLTSADVAKGLGFRVGGLRVGVNQRGCRKEFRGWSFGLGV